ncbi:MAG: Hsp70 family protein [Pseudohongiellaceae bacterium]
MTVYVGIDLGTTFSAVARLDEMGRSSLVHFSDGSNTLRSMVSFNDSGGVKIGARWDPKGAERFKREMGAGNWSFRAFDSTYSSTDLSAFVLARIRQEVEDVYGNIVEAVVTVPANFANDARDATMQAAKTAGINVKFIINEPTAAALYFAAEQKEQADGVYAIYDLGGGTFDISIIRLKGEEVEVIATDGVHKLGGRDFDDALTELVKKKFKEAKGEDLEIEDFTPYDAENLKKSLTDSESVKERIARANIEISRAEFEEAISSYITQTEMLCESVIDTAGIDLSEIKDVILVGGSTRMPIVASSVERVFGKKPVKFANPDEVVALGAAIYAAYKSDRSGMNQVQKDAVNKISFQEVTSKYYGTPAIVANEATGQEEEANTIIITKGDKIPCSVTRSYYTATDGQTQVNLGITECDALETDMNFVNIIYQGNLDLPPNRPAGQEIEITFSYDENQVMHAEFKDVKSGNKHEVDIQLTEDKASSINIDQFLVE